MNGCIAVIPARGGSKRIPRKNLVTLGEKPLIAWSIEWALTEPGVDDVYVSTDDEEIAAVAQAYGACVPYARAPEYATDSATDFDVFQEFADWWSVSKAPTKGLPAIAHVRPTTPFRRRGLVEEMLKHLQPGASVRTVSQAKECLWKMYFLHKNILRPALVHPRYPNAHNMPEQSLEVGWVHDGALDLLTFETLAQGSMTGTAIYGVENDYECHVDIDTPTDLEYARRLLGTHFLLEHCPTS